MTFDGTIQDGPVGSGPRRTQPPHIDCEKRSCTRLHLVADVIDRVPALCPRAAYAKQAIRDKLIEHKQYIAKHGEDLLEIRNWKWGAHK
jgi:xylulose-5-phosphate/fructose-6-phosphate phosphoketolase